MALDPRAQENAAKKVRYGRDMFVRAVKKTIEEWDTSDRLTRNLLIEGVLLHTRILHDFLIRDPYTRDDDISALHFLDNPTLWKEKRKIVLSLPTRG